MAIAAFVIPVKEKLIEGQCKAVGVKRCSDVTAEGTIKDNGLCPWWLFTNWNEEIICDCLR